MTQKCFKKERGSIKQRFTDRRKLLKPFIDMYGNPILVHAIDKKIIFKNQEPEPLDFPVLFF